MGAPVNMLLCGGTCCMMTSAWAWTGSLRVLVGQEILQGFVSLDLEAQELGCDLLTAFMWGKSWQPLWTALKHACVLCADMRFLHREGAISPSLPPLPVAEVAGASHAKVQVHAHDYFPSLQGTSGAFKFLIFLLVAVFLTLLFALWWIYLATEVRAADGETHLPRVLIENSSASCNMLPLLPSLYMWVRWLRVDSPGLAACRYQLQSKDGGKA
eukprot:scaffold54610_cov21-Tisochrysis_lutea.AAC.1